MSTALRQALVSPWFCALALAAPNAHSDVVTQWNETADVTSALAGGPPVRARITAMAQIAVHDALNMIDGRYEPYNVLGSRAPADCPGQRYPTPRFPHFVAIRSRPGGSAPKVTSVSNENGGKTMETTLNTLLTFTFFAPMALLVAVNLLTHRTTGPDLQAPAQRRNRLPVPPTRTRATVANDARYLEAA